MKSPRFTLAAIAAGVSLVPLGVLFEAIGKDSPSAFGIGMFAAFSAAAMLCVALFMTLRELRDRSQFPLRAAAPISRALAALPWVIGALLLATLALWLLLMIGVM